MNIVLIGMPGCGKSSTGRKLAAELGLSFLDSDRLIMDSTGLTLAELMEKHGDDGFRRIEDEINASICCDSAVIATGGSVVYGEKAMAHLRQIGMVIYLRNSCDEIRRRLGDLRQRGVTMAPGMTLDDLYAERSVLYQRYAHYVLSCEGLNLHETVNGLKCMVRKYGALYE